MEENKILFKCKHCENDDLKSMVINTIVQPNPEYRPFPYNDKIQPTLNVGLFVSCAKCEKDTVIIIDEFYKNLVQLDLNAVPEKALLHVKFEKPLFSAIKYVLTDNMELDKLVIDINNRPISMLTQEEVKIGYREISEEQYKGLKNKMVQEVGAKQEVKIQDLKPDESTPTRNAINNQNVVGGKK